MTSRATWSVPPDIIRVSRTLGWYASRVKVMSPTELITRAHRHCALKAWQLGHRVGWFKADALVPDVGRLSFCSASTPQLPELPWDLDALAAAAGDLMEGRLRVLNHEWTWSDDPDVWRRAPDTGQLWPQEPFTRIPYRDGNPYGDVRIVWEPARLQHLIGLALLARTASGSQRQRIVWLIERHLRSWCSANPYLVGVHYVSSMECALRVLAACYATDMVRRWVSDPRGTWTAVASLIHGHAELIRRRLSVHSSLGNHTIAEAAGLVYAGVLFPECDAHGRWTAIGLRLLEQEAAHQLLDDGGGVEQAWHYQRFVTDLYQLVVALLQRKNRPVPVALERAVARSQAFEAAFNTVTGRLPAIGDCDDGSALSPFLRFDRLQPAPGPSTTTFPSAGYTVVIREDGLRSRLIFDHGPLGMAPCYAHGHADALSILLDIGDLAVFIDPGTYTYTGHPVWRRYFRGTSAHNTVAVEGQDQAVQTGAFLWSEPFSSKLAYREATPDGRVVLLAHHDGYAKRFSVLHWRAVLYNPPGRWVILDRVTGRGIHRLDAFWHLGADPRVEGLSSQLSSDQVAVSIDMSGGQLSWHRGESDPPLGWNAPGYGIKVPVTTLRCRYVGPLPHEFVTVIQILHVGERRWEFKAAIAQLQQLIDDTCAH